jgi:hypothetical protein
MYVPYPLAGSITGYWYTDAAGDSLMGYQVWNAQTGSTTVYQAMPGQPVLGVNPLPDGSYGGGDGARGYDNGGGGDDNGGGGGDDNGGGDEGDSSDGS